MKSPWTDPIENHEDTQKTSSTRGINTSNKEISEQTCSYKIIQIKE